MNPRTTTSPGGRRLRTVLLALIAITTLGAFAPAQTAPSSLHVAFFDVDVLRERKAFGFRGNILNKIYGRARVVIRDDLGNAVAGASVRVKFTSGQFQKEEIVSGTTGADGSVTLVSTQFFTFKTTPTKPNGPAYSITGCVDSVSGSLPRDTKLDGPTCDTVSNP